MDSEEICRHNGISAKIGIGLLVMTDTIIASVRETLDRLRCELLECREPGGWWTGELSSSALSTATAVSALATLRQHCPGGEQGIGRLIDRGVAYLSLQQNEDGGFGDTDRSHSNVATSYLVRAALELAQRAPSTFPPPVKTDVVPSRRLDVTRLDRYLTRAGGLDGLRQRYGSDKTFVVPILTNLAIAGLVPWSSVPRLPFEFAVFPGSLYRFLRMPVVSYAIPALVAIGQAHHFRGPKAFVPLRALRSAAVAPTMRVLERMQPSSGGFLEATPLTSFVLMSLAASGRGDAQVANRCVTFLKESIRADGSWPIDTNLATWVTSLAISALSADPDDDQSWLTPSLIDWHLACQHRVRHPYTGADPGGWGWTDLSGAVPDGDDTPAALLAIERYQDRFQGSATGSRMAEAQRMGFRWLVRLQNRDGGIPTFCRGWGKLPFDRSSTDLTAHFVRAVDVRLKALETESGERRDRDDLLEARRRAIKFLTATQREDGSWSPLWFGNQDHPNEENPVYGTGRVLLAIASSPKTRRLAVRAAEYLLTSQNDDGGWGGGTSMGPRADWGSDAKRSSVEETAVAVEGLAACLRGLGDVVDTTEPAWAGREEKLRAAIIRGVEFLDDAVRAGGHDEAWPIGFYFAKLWYYEKLYPTIFTMAALGAALGVLTSERRDTR